MSAGRICSRTVVTASPDELVRAAAHRMAEQEVGTLVILAADGSREPIGILTDRDIVLRCVAAALDPETTPIARVMTRPVRVIDEKMPIEHAIARMADAATRRLVVTGADGRLVGILSLDDVLNLLVGEAAPIAKLLNQQEPHLAV